MRLKPLTNKKLGHLILHYLPYGFLAIWLLYFGTAFENTLQLAAQGRIDFPTAWTYRFRGTEFGTGYVAGNLAFQFWLSIVKLTGPRIFWAANVVVISLLLPRKSIVWKVVFLVAITAAVIYSEALLLWISTVVLLGKAVVLLRQRRIRPGIAAVVATMAFAAITLRWANPVAYYERHIVLGGKSLMDTIELRPPMPKVKTAENCVAIFNPDDLRGVNSIEAMDSSSLARFERVVILDLKIVEENYRLLQLKDEKGKPLFSDAARAFAAAEARYAQAILPEIFASKHLCLVANFDTPPQDEASPYSRARKILDARRRPGLNTKIIQLPAEPSRR